MIAAILVFGMIILIHELGHFLLAKRGGVGVIEFSIGMGPRLFSFVKGETRYSIKALPFGGSCMMQGEDEEESPTDQKAFNNKSVWTRISVIAAGPVFNFILAFALALVIISVCGYDPPRITGVEPGFPAAQAGLKSGDVIRKLNGQRITVQRDVTFYMYLHAGEELDVTYRRTENGVAKDYQTTIVPKYSQEAGGYLMGVNFSGLRQPASSVLETVKYGAYEVWYWIDMAVKSLGALITGQVGTDQVMGPVRMVATIDETVDETAQYGLETVLLTLANLCMLLSANLGVMNLLPIPALDGGRLVFLVIEAIRGKPLDREKEGRVHLAGMMVLMVLMVLILFNDIRSFL